MYIKKQTFTKEEKFRIIGG